MHAYAPAPRTMVMVYFGGFALLWAAVIAFVADAPAGSHMNGTRALLVELVLLALHAAIVFAVAWKAQRVLFERGVLALVFCGVPMIELAYRLWFVPLLLYAIAVAYVWMASSRESIGKLQAAPRR
jgi:hypothetical protein